MPTRLPRWRGGRSWGISHRALLDGEIFRLLTGTFLSHDFGMLLRQVCFALAVIGAYEWLEGKRRAMAAFVSIDILGSLLVLFVILPILTGPASIVDATDLFVHDVGMSAGGFGLLGALVARQRAKVALLALLLVAIGAKAAVRFEPIADIAHFICLPLGFAVQWSIEKLRPRASRQTST